MIVVKVGGGTTLNIDAVVSDIVALRQSGMELLLVHGGAQTTNAVGLSGLDGRVFEGTRKDTLRIRVDGRRMVLRDDWTGTVERVNLELLNLLIRGGYFPVLTPPGSSTDGEAINVDGDRAAAMVAGAFNANALVILTDQVGLLKNFPDESSLIAQIPKEHADKFMEFAEGRMKKKVMGAVEAIDEGVGKVIFADGRVDTPITKALAGAGTHIS